MTGLKSITVQVDTDKACTSRVGFAVALAARHGAELRGVFAMGSPTATMAFDAFTTLPLLETRLEAAKEAARQAGALFADAAGDAAAFSAVEDDWSPVVVSAAHGTDIVVLAQPSPDDDDGTAPPGMVSDVVMGAGGPVVMVPYIGASTDAPKTVLVGWKDSREAARAVRDGLPFMADAKVHVMTVNHHDFDRGLSGERVTEYLQAHGVDAVHAPTQSDGINVADTLVSRAADLNADMIVVGGYSHNRWRESVLGGVTRGLLGQMPVPVLMSH